jgi:hypothetical protein
LVTVPTTSIPLGYAEEGASISIKALEPTANSVRCAPGVGGGSPPAFGMRSTDVARRSARTVVPSNIALAEVVYKAVGECSETETRINT